MSDPLAWWPGKYAESKRIAQLVQDFLPEGDVFEFGGSGIIRSLLPHHQVTSARVSDWVELRQLPIDDDRFDIGISARVLELLPPPLRSSYLKELLRVSRYRAFVALPLQPELEAIDRVKNTYVWDTSRIWQHPGMRPYDLERLLEGQGISLTYHVESFADGQPTFWLPAETLQSLIEPPDDPGSDSESDLPKPGFVVAEIAKADAPLHVPAALSEVKH